MKTGGILSRLTGDIDTTTGLMQMAILSPALSVIKITVAIAILLKLNWRLALMALAIIPGAMLMSFISARRIRPIYRAIRKDAESSTAGSAKPFPASASSGRSAARCASCWNT
jgi:ATP-binding cassette subfamily B protein/subfamily B ATP-binding cassette protein MsbA